MSGKSNVLFWLERHGIDADEELVDRVFRRAKASTTVLTERKFSPRSTTDGRRSRGWTPDATAWPFLVRDSRFVSRFDELSRRDAYFANRTRPG